MAAIILQPSTTTAAAASLPPSPLSPLPPPANSFLRHPLKTPSSLSSFSSSKTPLFPLKPKSQFLQTTLLSLSKSQSLRTLLPQNPNNSPSFNNNDEQNQTIDDYLYLLYLSVGYSDIELAMAVHASILKIEENTRLFNSLIVAYVKLGATNHAKKVLKSLSCPDVVSYTAIISGLAKCGREIEAVELFFEMRSSGIEANEYSFVALLTACTRLGDIRLGFQLHSLTMKLGYLDFTYVGNALMGLYSKCGCLDFVLDVFDEMPQREIASWNTAISAVVKELMYDKAFEMFRDMLEIDCFRVDHFTLSTLLVASSGSSASMKGRELHAHSLRIGLETNLSVSNALIGFYTECGSVEDVESVFERMPLKDVITWTAMITSYMKFGLVDLSTRLFNSLIVAYVKLGATNHAKKVLKSLSCPYVASYTAIISGLAKRGREIEAVELFFEMRSSGIEANEYSFVALLTACTRLGDIELGFQLHSLMMKLGYLDFTYVGNALMGLYSKCGCLDFVLDVFDEMPQRDIASWNTAISAVVKELMYDKAFEMFRDMLEIDCFRVDHFTLSTLLVASSGSSASMKGRELHAHALRIGLETNLSVSNALIGFYTECGSVEEVESVFERMPLKDVITWTAMITSYMEFGLVDLAVDIFDKMPNKNCISYNAMLAGYCHNGKALRALNLFSRMVEEGGELSDFTLTSVVNACGLQKDKKTGEQIHGFVLQFGFGSNSFIEAALVDMCTRCERMAEAEKMFDRSPFNESLSIIWTSMICGYARDGRAQEAISLFCNGQSDERMIIDEFTYAAALGICGTLGFQSMGEQIHCSTLKSGFLSDIGVANALISMYCKCGKMKEANTVFNIMLKRDIVSHNGLMAGHILHWQGNEALALWAEMEKTGVRPDWLTFILIVSAYKYTTSNLVDECLRLFDSMKTKYEIEPTSEHYATLVSVLGYWDRLKEAEEIIKNMPYEPEISVWRALLHSCRIRLDPNIGKRAAKQILAMVPQDPSTYILVSNLYSASGRWHCSETMREEMRKKGFKKRPSQSWIIDRNKIHSFHARDKSHYQSKDIYSGLEILIIECLKAGYVPDTSFVLHEVEEHQKKDFLFYHSAKLAVTYGLLMNKPGKVIRVMKNILLCGDCHNFFKYVSVVTKRKIHVRDSSGFHCFFNGRCSCKDYEQ